MMFQVIFYFLYSPEHCTVEIMLTFKIYTNSLVSRLNILYIDQWNAIQ